jgi:hypothetical protein
MQEIWKDVVGYEGLYKVSNVARILRIKKDTEKLLTPHKESWGYFQVGLYMNGKRKTKMLHRLVYEAFKGPIKYTIDHIDGDKSNNRLDNLQDITQRQNDTKKFDKTKTSSRYTGVYFDKRRNNWQSRIQINGKTITLGRFINELDAANAYQKALSLVSDHIPPNIQCSTETLRAYL